MSVRFEPDNHEYFSGRKKLPSVTSVLAAANLVDTDWMSGTEYLDRGSLVHDVTARIDRGERVDMRRVPRKWRGCVAAWEKFKADTGVRVLQVEQVVGNDSYGGTFDRELLFRGDALTTMWDLKCSKTGRPADWVKYQLVAYAHAYKPGKMFNRGAVTLREDGTYAARYWGPETWLEDLRTFQDAVATTVAGGAWMDLTRRRR
jgi:hypothetical protein